jgi:hypothetical protein
MMFHTFSLVCHETRTRIWLGQGWDTMTCFFGGDEQIQQDLRRFLVDHMEKPLRLVCDDPDAEMLKYARYENGSICVRTWAKEERVFANLAGLLSASIDAPLC